MNADKRRWFMSVVGLVFAMVLCCSTTQAEDVKCQSLHRDFFQKPEAINLFGRQFIQWTFPLSEEWEEEQKETNKGFDGFIIAKTSESEFAYLLAIAPDMNQRSSTNVHPCAPVGNYA